MIINPRKIDTYLCGEILVKKDVKHGIITGASISKYFKKDMSYKDAMEKLGRSMSRIPSKKIDYYLTSDKALLPTLEGFTYNPYEIKDMQSIISTYILNFEKVNSKQNKNMGLQEIKIGQGLDIKEDSNKPILLLDFSTVSPVTIAMMFTIDAMTKLKAGELLYAYEH